MTVLNSTDCCTLDRETNYVLILWLSMLVLIPFDLRRFDGDRDAVDRKEPLMERILRLVKQYLALRNKSQDAAAFLASKFLTRPDIVQMYLSVFFDWAIDVIENKEKQHPDVARYMQSQSLSMLWTGGHRCYLQNGSHEVDRRHFQARKER